MFKLHLTRGLTTILDKDDYEKYSTFKWHATLDKKRPNYVRVARKNAQDKTVYLHRVILDAPKGMYVDHINGNPLDNRKKNLRLCTQSQNGMNKPIGVSNKSGFKGVCFCKQTKKWKATINVDKKQIWLGRHDTVEKAKAAYVRAAKKYHGEFAKF